DTGLGMGGRVRRFGARGDRRLWWNGEGGLAFGLERAGRSGRRLVMRFHVLVITIRVEHHLIPEDFVISAEVTAPTLACREGKGEQIEVKPRSDAAKCSNTNSVVKVGAGWS